MRAAWIRAERDATVRQEAGAWRRAGAIGDAALAAIEKLYPAAWPGTSPVWSLLAFFFVSVGVVGLMAAIANTWHALAATAFALAALLTVAAERLRLSASGASASSGAAAAFWAVICLLIGAADAGGWGELSWTRILFIGAAAWAAAAWHWGYFVFAVFSAAFFFLFLARFPPGRGLWLALGAILASACVPLLDRRALAPSHRRCAAAAFAVALIAVYAALNRYSLDEHLVESVAGWNGPASLSGGERTLAALATAAFPLFVLAWGIRSRRVLLLHLGIVFTALSLATLRYYVHIAPLWTVLTVAGAGCIGLALGAHRWLSRSPGRRRRGFTADALFQNEEAHQTLGVLGALALAPEARSPSPAEPGAFRGGGGASGGAGSSGSF